MQNFGYRKSPENCVFPSFLAFLSCRLALGELRCTTSSLQTVLLTFLHTRIAGQEASLLQGAAQLGVELQQSDENRAVLKKAGFLTRDPRTKERKKYGLNAARRAPQFSKR